MTEQDLAYQLHQKKRLDVRPRDQLSVIRMNSTYLESVDKWFGWKGLVSAIAIAIFLIFMLSAGRIAMFWLLEAAGILPSPLSSGVLLANGLGMAAVTG